MEPIDACSLSANRGSFLLQWNTITNIGGCEGNGLHKSSFKGLQYSSEDANCSIYTDAFSLPRHQIMNPGQGPPSAHHNGCLQPVSTRAVQ